MPNQASQRLKRLSKQIMNTWESRAITEVKAAVAQTSLALQNSLPEFLNQLSEALSTTVDRTAIRVKWDRDENTRIGKKHGRVRAGTTYTMDQLIFEYHILRQVICEVLEEEAPLTPIQREVIVCAVEQAVNDGATQFSETLRDIQEKLMHTLAHDIRGPITATKLSAQFLLKRPNDSDHCVKVASRIATSMDRVDLMIHDLLDASRLRAGESLKFDFEECDLDFILRQVLDETNFLHGTRLVFRTPGPVAGFWNEIGVRRVIDNLVTNALKFSTPLTPITIVLRANPATVEISIHNEGEPIPEKEQSQLFERFRRSRTADNQTGWGLGLTVVKGITEAHGGSVEMTSAPDHGTTFRVFLPRNLVRTA